MKKLRSKQIKIFFYILLILAITLITYLFLTRENFYLIENNGQGPIIYRSAQLKPPALEKLIKEKNIDVVLNLRGSSHESWYQDEKALCSRLGIKYYAYGFSVNRPPDKKRFLNLLDVLDYVKKHNSKLLIHCKAGADRTGMMSAVIQIYLYNFSVEEAASKSLNLWYGHLPDPNGALEQVIQRYKPYQKQMTFREWILTKYNRNEILHHVTNQQ